MPQPPSERRRHPRHPVNARLLLLLGTEASFPAQLKDISALGCRIETLAPVEDGADVLVRLSLLDGRFCTAEGRIVRHRSVSAIRIQAGINLSAVDEGFSDFIESVESAPEPDRSLLLAELRRGEVQVQ